MPGRIFPIRKVRSGPPAHFLGYPGKYFLSCARWHLVFLYIASALCLSSLPCLLLLYHSHRVPGLYVFHGFRLLSRVTVSIPQFHFICKHLFVSYFTTFHLRRPFQSAYPSVFSPKNAKAPGSCPPGSLFMGFYEILHYLCVLFFSISLLRDLLYAYKFKTSRTIDTNSVGRSSINIWYTGIYVMKSCRHILYDIKAIGTMSSIHRPSLLLKLS